MILYLKSYDDIIYHIIYDIYDIIYDFMIYEIMSLKSYACDKTIVYDII